MNFNLLAWIAALWRKLWAPRVDATAAILKCLQCPNYKAEMQESTERWMREGEENRLATRKAALAAAEAGEGPQPWDRDWYEHNPDVSDDIFEIGLQVGWHWVQEFLEVMDWAMASPQCQQAQAMADDPSNPFQGPLDVIANVRGALLDASHRLLRQEAEQLSYPNDWCEEFEQQLKSRARKQS